MKDNSTIKIAVIDDEKFYLKLWVETLEEQAEVFTFESHEDFLDKNKRNLNMYDYIILDMLFKTNKGNINILNINFSKTLRANGFDGILILNSNHPNQSRIELEDRHHFDLHLKKMQTIALGISKKICKKIELIGEKEFLVSFNKLFF